MIRPRTLLAALAFAGLLAARWSAETSCACAAEAPAIGESVAKPRHGANNGALQAVLEAEAERVAVIERAKAPVLAVFSPSGAGGGSGVVISPDGYALTNFHVVKPCGHALKCGMPDGRLYDAVIVGVDPTGDVALVKLFGRDDFPHAPLADSDRVRPGDWVFAMGNPFMLATDFQPTVTYGILSGVHRYQYPSGTILEYTDCLQTDASINPGNSGGPLFDASGRLLGVNGRASFDKRGRVNVGAAYAISINQVVNFLGHLKSGRIVDHATLDATVARDEDGRVVVTNILETSDAYRRGLRYDDEIVAFGGRPIATPNAFKNVLGIFPKGWRVPLSFRREGRRFDVAVRLSGVHAEAELLEKATGRSVKLPMPVPRPGDGPAPDHEPDPGGPHDGPIPRPGRPIRLARPLAEEPVPEVVQKHYEAGRGYANYYFNEQNRDRVWKAWTALGEFASRKRTWTIVGPLPGGGDEFALRITGSGASLELPGVRHTWSSEEEIGSPPAPPGSGGLLVALYLWRRLAVEGPGNFGQVDYLGTVPLMTAEDGNGEADGPPRGEDGPASELLPRLPWAGRLVDVLVGLHAGVECRFLFDPADGHLRAIEMFPEEHVDPCEIFFRDYRQVDGRRLPGRLEIRHGDQPYATLTLERFELEPAPAP